MSSYRRRSSNDPTKGSVAYLRKNEITIQYRLGGGKIREIWAYDYDLYALDEFWSWSGRALP